MTHLQDLMSTQNEALIKRACEDLYSMEDKVAMGFRGESLMALLGPIFQANPPGNMDQIRELLGQLIQQELQQELTKKEMSPESDPIEIQRNKLSGLASLLRSKVRIAELQKELIESQEDLATKIRSNPMLQAALQGMMGGAPGQMPVPGGPPGMPGGAPGAGGPPPALPPPPGMAPAGMGAAPPGIASAPTSPVKPIPESPMEAVTKTAPKK